MPCKMRVLNLVRGANWGQVSRTLASLKKDLGRHAEQDLPDRLEVSAACLDLLRERVHVAEAPLERAAREDRVDARCLVGEVCHFGRALDGVRTGEPHTRTIGDLDRRHVIGMRIDRGERLDQIGVCRAEPRLRARHVGLHDRVVGKPGQAAFVRRKPRSQAMPAWLHNQARTLALNACCTPRATTALSASTITSSGGLSVEALEGLVDCPSDLHVGPPGLRSFHGTPTSARTRGRAAMGCRLSLSRLEGTFLSPWS